MDRIKYQLTLSVALCLTAVSQAPAQQPLTIREPTIGVEFTVPEGWQYQKPKRDMLWATTDWPALTGAPWRGKE